MFVFLLYDLYFTTRLRRKLRKKGRLEDWKIGRMEEWKNGRMEEWKNGMLECWNDGRRGRNVNLLNIIDVYVDVLFPVFQYSIIPLLFSVG
jgi:hypothetical protein